MTAAVLAQQLRRSGFVGVVVVAVPDDVRRLMGVPGGIGVLVQSTVQGGSAGAAGIRAGDVIASIDGHDVTGVSDFVDRVRAFRAGDTVTVTLRRDRESLSLHLSVRPRPYEAAPDVDVRYDAVRVDGALRRTIITSPQSRGRHPAIVYLNGIGCFSQESLDLSSNDARLLYGLTRRGYVTMRVEKSGIGDSEGPSCNSPAADFRAEVRTYASALRALKQYEFVDPRSTVLLGLSIGGVEAPLVAALEPVRAIIVVNTVAKPFLEYLLDTRRRQLSLAHIPVEEIDRRMRIEAECNSELLTRKRTPDMILASRSECAEPIAFPAPFTFVQQWADVSPAAAWKAVNEPVLVVYGTSDFVATVADQPDLAAMINAFHPGNASVEAIAGMDHTLSKAATMEESFNRKGAGEFAPAIVTAIGEWLDRTATAPR